MRKPAGDNRTPAYLLERAARALCSARTLEYAQTGEVAPLIAIHHPQHGRSTGRTINGPRTGGVFRE